MGPPDEWVLLVIDGQGGAVRGESSAKHRVNINLFASRAS